MARHPIPYLELRDALARATFRHHIYTIGVRP